MKSTEDRAVDYISATCLRVLRYLALLAALLLPGLYVAMATYHQEMIPTKLLLAIIDSKQEVPFDTVFEVIGLLAAFELLQEAGLHLPQAIGTAVSIIGGLAVGTTAVDARLISPAALIVAASARDLRLYAAEPGFVRRHPRLAVRAGDSGWRGRPVRADGGGVLLLIHLSGLTSLDVSYLTPFSDARQPTPSWRPRLTRRKGARPRCGRRIFEIRGTEHEPHLYLAAGRGVGRLPLHAAAHRTDAAKLLPAQVLVIGAGDGAITVEADNGAAGSGPTLAAALADMAECAEGTLFLDTAEHIVLLQSAGALLPAAAQQPQFRPAAKLYLPAAGAARG